MPLHLDLFIHPLPRSMVVQLHPHSSNIRCTAMWPIRSYDLFFTCVLNIFGVHATRLGRHDNFAVIVANIDMHVDYEYVEAREPAHGHS